MQFISEHTPRKDESHDATGTVISQTNLEKGGGLDTDPCPSGVDSPGPLLGPAHRDHGLIDRKLLTKALKQSQLPRPSHDITEREEVLPDPVLELAAIHSRRAESVAGRRPSHGAGGFEDESGSPTEPMSQGVPPELPNLLAEIIFVAVCSAGQVVFSLTYGHATVVQFPLRDALGIEAAQTPWLLGSSLLASGLSVIIAGSLADLAAPKLLMVGAFLWQAVWNGVIAGAIRPELKVLFFVARAMQGLSVGILVSASMSILGRVYNPGIRKTRVFSAMAGASPLGFWIGCLQGGALGAAHLPWIFGSTAVFLGLCALAAQLTLPDLSPAKDSMDSDAPSLKQFDYLGAALASVGCGKFDSVVRVISSAGEPLLLVPFSLLISNRQIKVS